jgi:hypothetical protein
MQILKNPRFVLLIILFVVSIFLVLPRYTPGVRVTFVGKKSACRDVISEGDIITMFNERPIVNQQDFYDAVKTATGIVRMNVNRKPLTCEIPENETLNIKVKNLESRGLVFGTDIQGGVLYILEPRAPVNTVEILNKLNKRIETYGMTETRAISYDNKIGISTIYFKDIRPLIEVGALEAKIQHEIELKNNTGRIKIGNDTYVVKRANNGILVNNSYYTINQSFYLDNIKIYIENVTEKSLIISALFFSNDDVVEILKDYSYVKYDPNYRIYRFVVPVRITNEASRRFAKITTGLRKEFIGAKFVLKANLVLTLDGETISKLSIPLELAGKPFETPSVTGFTGSREEALNKKMKLYAVLESGPLPTELKVVEIREVEPKTSLSYFTPFFLTEFVVFSIFLLVRYKSLRILAYTLLLLILEIIAIIGVFALGQRVTYYNSWIITPTVIYGFVLLIAIAAAQIITECELILRFKKISRFRRFFTPAIFLFFFIILLIPSLREISIVNLIGMILNYSIINPLCIDFIKKFRV